MFTSGALPKEPDTLTAEAAEEFEEEPPHPARATVASRGSADSTAIRRMGRKPCRCRLCRLGGSPASLPAGRPGPAPDTSRAVTARNDDRPHATPTRRPFAPGLLYPPVVTSHPGDELLHPLVGTAERVLAQHRPLCLVIQLEVDPVHGEVPPPLLGAA